MSIEDFRNKVIPAIHALVGVPIVEADQTADAPEGLHASYKVTLPYAKGVGQPDRMYKDDGISLDMVNVENYKATVSITTYAFDDPENGIFDLSENLAQDIHDWFRFHGEDILGECGIVIMDATDVSNRDTIIVENYERRHGFDCIMRMSREIVTKDVGYFDRVEL